MPTNKFARNVKLTEEEVIEIREKYVPYQYSIRMLAEDYNVHQSTIHRIVTKQSWRDLS